MNTNYNATKHGCCALETLILPTESLDDLKVLEAAWHKTYQPKHATEIHLVDQLIAADWLLQRSVRTLAALEKEIASEQPNPRHWTEDDHHAITRFQRYRTANQNAFNKCRRAVEDHYKARVNDHRQDEKLALQKERHSHYLQTHKPKPTLEEALDTMRRKAIELREAGLASPQTEQNRS